MCDALMEIVKPKVEAKVQEAVQEAKQLALEEGRMKEKIDLIRKKLAKNISLEEIADFLEEPVEDIKNLIDSQKC